MLKTPEHSDLRTCQDFFLCLGDLECGLVSGKTGCLIPAAVQSLCFAVQGELQNLQHFHIAWKRMIRSKITSRSFSSHRYVCVFMIIAILKRYLQKLLSTPWFKETVYLQSRLWHMLVLGFFIPAELLSLRHTEHSREAQLSLLCCVCNSRLKWEMSQSLRCSQNAYK